MSHVTATGASDERPQLKGYLNAAAADWLRGTDFALVPGNFVRGYLAKVIAWLVGTTSVREATRLVQPIGQVVAAANCKLLVPTANSWLITYCHQQLRI